VAKSQDMFYVCILQSKKNERLYKGVTNDLKRRLKEHNSGSVPFTKTLMPWILIYYEAFSRKEDAAREEKFLKSGKGRERIKWLLKSFFEKTE
jgi:putative endonuclease